MMHPSQCHLSPLGARQLDGDPRCVLNGIGPSSRPAQRGRSILGSSMLVGMVNSVRQVEETPLQRLEDGRSGLRENQDETQPDSRLIPSGDTRVHMRICLCVGPTTPRGHSIETRIGSRLVVRSRRQGTSVGGLTWMARHQELPHAQSSSYREGSCTIGAIGKSHCTFRIQSVVALSSN